MKKILLFMIIAVCSLFFVSCGFNGSKDGGNGLNEKEESKTDEELAIDCVKGYIDALKKFDRAKAVEYLADKNAKTDIDGFTNEELKAEVKKNFPEDNTKYGTEFMKCVNKAQEKMGQHIEYNIKDKVSKDKEKIKVFATITEPGEKDNVFKYISKDEMNKAFDKIKDEDKNEDANAEELFVCVCSEIVEKIENHVIKNEDLKKSEKEFILSNVGGKWLIESVSNKD